MRLAAVMDSLHAMIMQWPRLVCVTLLVTLIQDDTTLTMQEVISHQHTIAGR